MSENSPGHKRAIRIVLIGAGVLAAIALAATLFDGVSPATQAPAETGPAWVYTSSPDPMTDTPSQQACVKSNNKVSLQWPYRDVHAWLCIRQHPRMDLSAYVVLDGDGQIICRSSRNCTVPVRFGDDAAQSVGAGRSADGSSNIIFFRSPSRFITNIKRADVTRVVLTLYQAGEQTVEFDTADLEWPRPPA